MKFQMTVDIYDRITHCLEVISISTCLLGFFTIIGYFFDKNDKKTIWLTEMFLSFSIVLFCFTFNLLITIYKRYKYTKINIAINEVV